jgi:hypothetical protein
MSRADGAEAAAIERGDVGDAQPLGRSDDRRVDRSQPQLAMPPPLTPRA